MEKINKKVTLEPPITNADLHNKLFNAIYANRAIFEKGKKVFLFVLKKEETNRRIFFSNHADWNKDDYVLMGSYMLHNFYAPTASALAFSQTILDRLKSLR